MVDIRFSHKESRIVGLLSYPSQLQCEEVNISFESISFYNNVVFQVEELITPYLYICRWGYGLNYFSLVFADVNPSRKP